MTHAPDDIERLVRAADALPDPAARATARELARALLAYHGEGLARLVGLVDRERLALAAAGDALLASLLALHELAPEAPAGFVPLSQLRSAAAEAKHERCGPCGALLGEEHAHLVVRGARQLACACQACAILFDSTASPRYRRIPARVVALPDFQLDDATWNALGVPVGLAFFTARPSGVVACYPGPAGAVEAAVEPRLWTALVAANPWLAQLDGEVEALLVHRLGEAREHYRVSIDACYRLVGLVRGRWTGMSGGAAVQSAITSFFGELRGAAA